MMLNKAETWKGFSILVYLESWMISYRKYLASQWRGGITVVGEAPYPLLRVQAIFGLHHYYGEVLCFCKSSFGVGGCNFYVL